MSIVKTIAAKLTKLPQNSRRASALRATVIGVVAGLAALALEFGAYFLSMLRVNASSVYPAWLVLPGFGLLGGLTAGFLVQKFSPTAYGSGIPQVRAYLLGAKLPLNMRLAMVKLIGGSIALGSGLFMGREGPTVHVGAAIAASLNKWFPTNKEREKQLIAAGAGAGLAAAFNAPIAGVLFVAEELLKDVSTDTIGTAILACFVASTMTHILNAPHMESSHQIQAMGLKFTWHDMLFWVILGALSGILGTLFNRGVILFLRFNRDYFKMPVFLKVGLAGLLSGAIIAMIPADAHFRDYAALRDLTVAGSEHWYMVPCAFIAFFFLTLLAYGSGAPGGLFAPAIVLGSALGAMVAYLEYYLFQVGSTETMAMVGMGAFFAAVARVPITAVVIVTEMTRHYDLVPPLMVACATACFVGAKIEAGSVYDMLREYSGLDQEIKRIKEEESGIRAKDLLKPASVSLKSNSSSPEIIQMLKELSNEGIPVFENGNFLGLLELSSLLKRIDLSLPEKIEISEFLSPSSTVLKPESTLPEIREAFEKTNLATLAVVENEEFLGLIHRSDIDLNSRLMTA
ncbi:MAG: chloride channel protein [Candidatus Obscuribacterales bacterium]|nr:chloride channel protein [Candidatus Obscuribacterales bacterium]